jgi:hypothetical protein
MSVRPEDVTKWMDDADMTCAAPLDQGAIDLLREHAPLVELSAKGVVWADLLREAGIECISCTVDPGLPMDFTDTIDGANEYADTHTLLLVRPINNEWLKEWRGGMVIYVGEHQFADRARPDDLEASYVGSVRAGRKGPNKLVIYERK